MVCASSSLVGTAFVPLPRHLHIFAREGNFFGTGLWTGFTEGFLRLRDMRTMRAPASTRSRSVFRNAPFAGDGHARQPCAGESIERALIGGGSSAPEIEGNGRQCGLGIPGFIGGSRTIFSKSLNFSGPIIGSGNYFEPRSKMDGYFRGLISTPMNNGVIAMLRDGVSAEILRSCSSPELEAHRLHQGARGLTPEGEKNVVSSASARVSRS